jgi:hypothetical protein
MPLWTEDLRLRRVFRLQFYLPLPWERAGVRVGSLPPTEECVRLRLHGILRPTFNSLSLWERDGVKVASTKPYETRS